MADLSVNIAGVNFNNPIIAASGTFGFGHEYKEFYPLNTLGGISCKGIFAIITVPCFLNDLPWLKKQGTVIIANIAGNTPEDYCMMAEKLSDTDVDMIEMNISCPNVRQGGVQFGTSCAGVESITTSVRKFCKKPLMVKLSPNVSDIAEIAAAAESAGADAISMINTLTGMRININTHRPIIRNNTGGLSGPALLPVAVRMIYQAKQRVKIPIVGMGGISKWEDAVEILLAGAAALQIGTAFFTDPYTPIKVLKGINQYLDNNKISRVTELTGKVIPWN